MGAFFNLHLSFPNHMHDLDAGQSDARAPKTLETQHRFRDAFDGPVILFDNVVQVLALPDLDRCFLLGIDRLGSGANRLEESVRVVSLKNG